MSSSSNCKPNLRRPECRRSCKLPCNDRRTTTSPGDIILYQGNSLTIYYDTNSWNFTPLGHVNGVSTRGQMLNLLGGKGSVEVTLSL